ncbi:hypothetical protein RFI_07165, partial [Reticulomyxa filosa]
MTTKTSKKQNEVHQQLLDMGFEEEEVRQAVEELFFVGMDVWVWTTEKGEWVAGQVVSITQQLISIIFNGNDFRWVENDSDHFNINHEKPTRPPKNYQIREETEEQVDSDQPTEQEQEQEQEQPQALDEYRPSTTGLGEMDYTVVFPENVLGLELYSDESGLNCVVGRCVSQIARQNVRPGSAIIQVNGQWVAGRQFEEIRDAVKQAAKDPPLEVKFRIRQKIAGDMLEQQQRQNEENEGETDEDNDKSKSLAPPERSPDVSGWNSSQKHSAHSPNNSISKKQYNDKANGQYLKEPDQDNHFGVCALIVFFF